ncbi:MAG: hypothetical protein HYZ81_13015 [Nitrospinae bacterium]|nr:hypothetical protein [Nitrospinota bacterium]
MSPVSLSWTLIATIVVFGALSLLLPVIVRDLRRYREARFLTCPETGEKAAIIVDGPRASSTATIAEPRLRAIECSLWPKRKGCEQSCLKKP